MVQKISTNQRIVTRLRLSAFVLLQVSTQSHVTPHTARQASWLGWIKASKIGRRSLVASAVMSQVPKQISVHAVAQATERSAAMIRRDKSEE